MGEVKIDLVKKKKKKFVRFGKFVDDGDLNKFILDVILLNIKKSILWVMKVFDEWWKFWKENGEVIFEFVVFIVEDVNLLVYMIYCGS